MSKKILAMLMALAMIISMVPMTAMATECDHAGATVLAEQAATCGFNGYKITKCPNCGVFKEDYPATGAHVFVDGMCECGQWEEINDGGEAEHECVFKVVRELPATCTQPAYVWEECECGASRNGEVGFANPAAHGTETFTKTTEATCVKEGLKETFCKACYELLNSEVLPVNENHAFHNGKCLLCGKSEACEHAGETYTETVMASCSKEGSITTFCKACNEELSVETLAKNDDHSFYNGVCLLCGETNECKHEYEVVKKLNATCIEPAYVWYKCTLCGEEMNREEGEVSSEHNYEIVKKLDATCIEPAYVWYKCVDCGAEMNREEGEVSSKHNYEIVKELDATCTEAGYVWYKCADCGMEMNHEEGEAIGHNYIAHSNNDGTHLLVCNCGKSVKFTCLDSDGDGKCDSCGYQKYPTCDHKPGPWKSNDNGTHTSACACGKNTTTEACQFIGSKCQKCGYEKHVDSDASDTPIINAKPVVNYSDYDDVPKTGDVLSMILAFFGF